MWWWYKFLNFFSREKQIAPQNSLNTQISTVVHQRFEQFKEKDFIVPLNRLIIRSLGIEPDGEKYEIESLFDNTFTKILLPMLGSELAWQITSLADALYNVIPQNQNEKSFNGVKYAISKYIGDAMMKCWVEAIFDFIRQDSSKHSMHLSWRNHEFDADKYFNNSKDNEYRKNQFKKISSDRFSESLSNIVANVEQSVKNGKNDHEICEDLLKYDVKLLDFCDKLHERNFGQLSKYLQGCIKNMTPAEKDVLSNLQLNLKFSILNCRSENKDKASENSEKDFLDNLSPSSKKAYEQREELARESANALKSEKEGKENIINNQINVNENKVKVGGDFDLPNAYKGSLLADKDKKTDENLMFVQNHRMGNQII